MCQVLAVFALSFLSVLAASEAMLDRLPRLALVTPLSLALHQLPLLLPLPSTKLLVRLFAQMQSQQ